MIQFSELKDELTGQQESRPAPPLTPVLPNGQPPSIFAAKLYRAMATYLTDAFGKAAAGQSIDCEKGRAIIKDIVNSPISRDHWFAIINEIRYPSSTRTFLVFHCANVAIYSICLSMTMKLDQRSQSDIGLLALLHDIGKALIPDEVLFKSEQLTSHDWEVLRQYPFDTYKILRSSGLEDEILTECALQVNESIDGNGYPRGLKGDSIHPFAQMVGLVDVYEAMTSHRPYRQKLLHYDAIKEILRTRKSSFSQAYIKALLKTFSVFPLQSYVKLNSGVIGRIVAVHEELPMRPKIEVTYDAEGQRLAVPMVIDLATQPFLYITAPVSEDQLPVRDSKIRIIA